MPAQPPPAPRGDMTKLVVQREAWTFTERPVCSARAPGACSDPVELRQTCRKVTFKPDGSRDLTKYTCVDSPHTGCSEAKDPHGPPAALMCPLFRVSQSRFSDLKIKRWTRVSPAKPSPVQWSPVGPSEA